MLSPLLLLPSVAESFAIWHTATPIRRSLKCHSPLPVIASAAGVCLCLKRDWLLIVAVVVAVVVEVAVVLLVAVIVGVVEIVAVVTAVIVGTVVVIVVEIGAIVAVVAILGVVVAEMMVVRVL